MIAQQPILKTTNTSCVYWIRRLEHTDIYSEGYIGVTRKGEDFRFNQHIKAAARGKRGKLYSNIRKYGDSGIVMSVLVVGLEEYCYEVEEKLRPTSKVGWNSVRGGMTPDRTFQNEEDRRNSWISKLREANLGNKLSEDTLKTMSLINLERWKSDECFQERMRDILLGNRKSYSPGTRFWARSKPPFLIADADRLYTAFIENPRLYSRELLLLVDKSYTEMVHKRSAVKLIQKFASGWNPSEDFWWLHDFKGLSIDSVPDYLHFPDSWLSKSTKDDVWSLAGLLYSEFISGLGPSDMANKFGLKTSSLSNIYRNFRNGWNPQEDPRWVSWVDSLTHKGDNDVT